MLLVTHADIPFSVIIFNDFLFCGWEKGKGAVLLKPSLYFRPLFCA